MSDLPVGVSKQAQSPVFTPCLLLPFLRLAYYLPMILCLLNVPIAIRIDSGIGCPKIYNPEQHTSNFFSTRLVLPDFVDSKMGASSL